MSLEENKTVVRRVMQEIIEGKNLDLIDELVAPDIVEHEDIPGVDATGSEGFRQWVMMLHAGFSDLSITIEELIAEGDKVVARHSSQGTHTGDFIGISPTGRQVNITGIDILRLANGRVVEHWGQTDNLSMLQQLGAMPVPEEPAAA